VRRLPNGARVVVQTTPRSGPGAATVAIQLWVLAGTADERSGEHGCAHLLEHMLFKPLEIDGTKTDIASRIEALGGDVNAFTSHDETVFHATVPLAVFAPALRALLRPIAWARPSSADLEQEAEVVLEEIKQYDDDPGARSMQDMVAGLFGEHDYARPVLGTAA
jgi:zinc protease